MYIVIRLSAYLLKVNPLSSSHMHRVIRGSVDIALVLLMSTSWTSMLSGIDPGLQQYTSGMPCRCVLTAVYEISPPLNLARRDIACIE